MSLPDEDTTVLKLSQFIRKHDVNGITTCLAQLKRDQFLCKNFVKHDGLRILVKLFHKAYKANYRKILNMSLSIFADACLSTNARKEVQRSNIIKNIILIMGNTIDSFLQYHYWRLIRNLCQHSRQHVILLCDSGIVTSLATTLQSKINIKTYLMAVKAVRDIWIIYDNSRKLFMQAHIVKLITKLFIMARERCNEPQYVELVDVCLKAMNTFLSDSQYSVASGEQMEVNKEKQGYKCLLQCCGDGNKIAIECLNNFCKTTNGRLMLSTCGVVEQLIDLIKSNPEVSNKILESLCRFCWDSVNRAKINKNGGLELFLIILKKPELEKYHPILLDALVQFSYCDLSIAILVKHGILEVLVAKLMNPIAKPEKKDVFIIRLSRIPSDYEMNYMKWELKMETESMKFNYSPIYSDDDKWVNNDKESRNKKMDSLKNRDSATVDTKNVFELSQQVNRKKFCEYKALMLLERLCLLPMPIESLADSLTIKALLTYIKKTSNEKAIFILTKIVLNAAYFLSLLKQGFVFDVQNVLNDASQFMHPLRSVAETGGSIGQLSLMLLRGEEQFKLVTAVSIPFLIVNSRESLKRLLHNHGGLQIILRLLNEPSHELYEWAIWSIFQLATTLQIKKEILDTRCTADDDVARDHSHFRNTDHSEPTVMFELDDGTTVKACKRILCERSDFFSVLLEGSFSESGKKRVRLRDVSHGGLNTLILTANGASYKDQSIESILDAVLLADKFLMFELSDALAFGSIENLNYKTFSRAWCWARINACPELRICCVKMFLITVISRRKKLSAFHDFAATDAFDEFLHDVREIIMEALCQPLW